MAASPLALQQWESQRSGTDARLRGISVVDEKVAWASGARGTVLRTIDGGRVWQALKVPGAEKLDFRDVDAVSDRVAYVLSIGNGPDSRIYKTEDSGQTWTLQFQNDDPKAFFDAMAFWDATRGIAFSDSIDGRFVIIRTLDGGTTWTRIPGGSLPPALDNEGAFAASGTNVAVFGKQHVWIGTGAAATSRVLHSADAGATWTVADTPLAAGPSTGIFSIAFRDARHGIVVGGDYSKENDAVDNAAVTSDGGKTWKLVAGLTGYRSVVAHLGGERGWQVWLAVGP
ncbi:MAG TPA: YCF48-related protein, partial [Vicinamibacterales bacterium]